MPNRGFTPIIAIIILAVVLVGGVFVFNIKRIDREKTGDERESLSNGLSREAGQSHGLYGKCEGTGTKKLTTFPLDARDIELIIPMGRVQDSHVTPTDHQYIIPKETKGNSLITDDPEKYQIKAPFDGFITNIELFKEPVEKAYRKDPYKNNYLVVFEYSCDYYV